MSSIITRFKRLVSDDESTNGVIVEKTVMAIIEQSDGGPSVRPLSKGCPIWLEDKYRNFRPHYRNRLETFSTELIEIRWSDEVRQYVAVYLGNLRYVSGLYFVWGFINSGMVELEQVCRERPISYDVDRRWLATVTG